jgi:exopolysaccharide biosynthesis protein
MLRASLVLTLSSGCGPCGGPTEVETPDREATSEAVARETPTLPTISPTERTIEPPGGGRYVLHRFRFPLSRTTLRVSDLAFERTLSEALEAEEATLAINGGYWDTAREPEGLTRVGDVELSAFRPSLGGGVLVIADGVGRLLDAEADDFTVPDDVDFAQQCMPRIVVDGALNIRQNDGRRADRTALCLRDEGRTLDVYIARGRSPDGHGGPTLWDFGEVLVAEGCESALNLDGGSSTGAVFRGEAGIERLPARVPIRLAILFE